MFQSVRIPVVVLQNCSSFLNVTRPTTAYLVAIGRQERRLYTLRLVPKRPLSWSVISRSGESAAMNGGTSDIAKGPVPLSRMQKFGYIMFGSAMLLSFISGAIMFALPQTDSDGNVVEDEYSGLPFFSQHWQRLCSRIFKTKAEFENPFSDKLLPDPLPAGYVQPEYTVMIELTGVLVHADWHHKHGWRFQKRPGLDMFLSQVGYPNFELVIFTREGGNAFFPIIDQLDPKSQFIMYRLFRDACRYMNGTFVKDISASNRRPKKVIVIDWDREAVQLQPENSLILPKWTGDTSDKSLVALAQLLQVVRESKVDDVRDVLAFYNDSPDPIAAFRENQRRLEAEAMEAAAAERDSSRSKPQRQKSLFGRLGSTVNVEKN